MTGPLEERIPYFLLKYRVTPQTTTGIAPDKVQGEFVHLDLLQIGMQSLKAREEKLTLELRAMSDTVVTTSR